MKAITNQDTVLYSGADVHPTMVSDTKIPWSVVC